MEIFCECQDCKHSANVDVESNLKDINNIIDKITCSKCSSKNINIFFQNVLIYSFSNRKECRICGKVIIEPRKNLTDNSDTCCACAQRIEEDSEKIFKTQNDDTYTVIKKFKIDKNTKRCPKCHAPLEVVWNKRTDSEFLGCSNYPDCQYSEPLK